MYAITMHLSGAAVGPIFGSLAETHHLPPIPLLIAATNEEAMLSRYSDVQVYVLDNLREPIRRFVYEVRFKTHRGGSALTTLYLSVEFDGNPHQLSLQFSAKGDRGCSSRVIGWLKEGEKRGEFEPEFEIAGYSEDRQFRYVCEHSLSVFDNVKPY